MGSRARFPNTAIDVADVPQIGRLVEAVQASLKVYGSVVVHDVAGRHFASFIVMWWHGVYVIRGEADLRLGTFASIEAAIRAGQSRPHPTPRRS